MNADETPGLLASQASSGDPGAIDALTHYAPDQFEPYSEDDLIRADYEKPSVPVSMTPEARRLYLPGPSSPPAAVDPDAPPPAAVGERGAYQVPDPSIPETLNIRGMFGPPPGINLREAEKTLRDLEGYEREIGKSEQAAGGLLAERTALIQQQSMAEQALVKEQADIKRKAIDAQREADNLRLKAMEEAKADVRSKISGLQDLQNSLASAKIDPNRFWTEKSTGQKVAIAIGIALSSFGSILSGGKQPNYALDIIDKAIDRDLDAQKADIDRLGMRINIQQSLIAQTRAIAQDDQASYAAAKAMAYDRVSEQLDLATLRYKDETTKSRLALLGNDVAARAQDFRMKTLDHLSGAASRRFGAQFQIAQAKHEAARGTWAIQMQLASKMGTQQQNMGLNPGLKPYAGGPPQFKYAAKANEHYEELKNLEAQFDKLIDIAKMPIHKRMNFDMRGIAGAISSVMTSDVGKQFGLGKLSEADFELLRQVIRNPTQFTAANVFTVLPLATLRASKSALRDAVRSKLRGLKADFELEPEAAPPEEEEED